MNILALETSTEACSVALLNANGQIYSQFDVTPREHTRYLPLMMSAVLREAGLQKRELTHIAYASGPGAFTGVRIAASTAQGLAIGLGLPLVAVSSLAVLAQQASAVHGVEQIMASLDARMGEAYVADYRINPDSGLVELQGAERLLKLENLQALPSWFLAGSGFRARREAGLAAFDQPLDEDALPHAASLVILARQAIAQGKTVSADLAPINYIRNKVAEKKKEITP